MKVLLGLEQNPSPGPGPPWSCLLLDRDINGAGASSRGSSVCPNPECHLSISLSLRRASASSSVLEAGQEPQALWSAGERLSQRQLLAPSVKWISNTCIITTSRWICGYTFAKGFGGMSR